MTISISKNLLLMKGMPDSESWNFTSRLAIKVSKLPPPEYCAFAGIPQGHRKDMAIDDLLPNDDDDRIPYSSQDKSATVACQQISIM